MLAFGVKSDGRIFVYEEFTSVDKVNHINAAEGMAVVKDGNLYSMGSGDACVPPPMVCRFRKLGFSLLCKESGLLLTDTKPALCEIGK